ncbi:hypothetical protein MLGJGCBP_00256 [Rhodococcus sp. T7]|nr:hypothetical protein MLGJGCBP_10170 [Rhodococcus sp. T7]KAF0966581.1 hypothetical protein MLGJGCBP_00256 [Rhodococcus sp. T7]
MPPTTGGFDVHGHLALSTGEQLTLDLLAVRAFPEGLHLRMAVTATGRTATAALHQTRALTDPADLSAQWSYLAVRVRVDDCDADADPSFPKPDTQARSGGLATYRTEPHYWIGTVPTCASLMFSAGWPEIGLDTATTTVYLESHTVSPD